MSVPAELIFGAARLVRGAWLSGGEAHVADVLVLAPLRAEVDDRVADPRLVEGGVVLGHPGLDDAVPVADVQRAVGDHALAGAVDLGLVQRVELDAGAAPLAVEAGEKVAGDVVAADGAVGRLDAFEVAAVGGASAVEPRLEGAVGDGQSRLPGRLPGVIGAGEVVQPGEQSAPCGDRGGDEPGERVEAAGDGLVALQTPVPELS